MKNNDLILLGQSIRNKRLQNGLSQEELAERTHLHRTYIGGIERGERNLSYLNLKKISNALGLSISDLLSEDH